MVFANVSPIRVHCSLIAPIALALSALAAVAPAAHAQANLTFTGANNSPITINFLTPLTYTVTAASSQGFLFDFQGAGNFTAFNENVDFSGLTFQINGGATQTVTTALNGSNPFGNVAPGDLLTYSSASSVIPDVSVGDVVTLSSGTLKTSSVISSPPPANGMYTTFLINNDTGRRISTNGIVGPTADTPEPGTLSLVGMGLAGGAGIVGTVRRRRIKQSEAE